MKRVLTTIGMLLAAASIAATAACSSNSTQTARVASAPDNSVHTVPAPKLAIPADIVKSLGGTGWTDTGSAELFVIDSGTFTINGARYALDTFMNKTDRDDWLSVATNMGVVPKWEGDQWVAYPSTDD